MLSFTELYTEKNLYMYWTGIGIYLYLLMVKYINKGIFCTQHYNKE